MSSVLLTPPPYSGEDLRAVYSYLYTLHEELTGALGNLTADNFATEEAGILAGLKGGGLEKQARQAMAKQTDSLRSLIIKTADTVETELNALRETLRSDYLARSEFGTYREQAENRLEATAQGIVQNFTYTAETTPLQEGMVNFASYISQTKAYIKTGLLYVESGAPVYGVAVGQDLKSATYTVDGQPVEGIQQGAAMAQFTANELSFWNQGTKVAWMSNQELHISHAVADRTFTIGNCRAYVEGGLIRWTGV